MKKYKTRPYAKVVGLSVAIASLLGMIIIMILLIGGRGDPVIINPDASNYIEFVLLTFSLGVMAELLWETYKEGI